MLVRPNGEADHNRIQKWRIATHVALRREIRSDVEFELITTRLHCIAFEQRCVAASVAIGRDGCEHSALLAQRIKPYGDIARWLAVRSVENVRSQLSHRSPGWCLAIIRGHYANTRCVC